MQELSGRFFIALIQNNNTVDFAFSNFFQEKCETSNLSVNVPVVNVLVIGTSTL